MAQPQVGVFIELDGAFKSKVKSNEKAINRDHLKKLLKLLKVNKLE